MYGFTSEEIDVEAIRARLRRMTAAQLVRYGRAAAYLANAPSYGPPRETWTVQLAEARSEWRRRKTENITSYL